MYSLVANSDHVHQNTRVCERDFGPHVLGDAGRGVQGDGLPDQIRFRIGYAVAAKKLPRRVGAIDLKPLCVGMIGIDET